MGVHIIHSRLAVGGRDYTSRIRSVDLSLTNDIQDVTVMNSNTKLGASSLNDLTLAVEGLNEFGTGLIDEDLNSKFGGVQTQYLVSAEGGDFGEIGYFFDGVLNSLMPISGNVGVITPIKFNVRAASDVIRGTILEDGFTTRTVTGNGSNINLGTAPNTKKIWAQLQVLSGSASTLDVVIESDVSGFATPITRLTFAQVAAASAPTSQFISAVGPGGTDDFWRAKWTIGGASNWLFLVTFGIQ